MFTNFSYKAVEEDVKGGGVWLRDISIYER